MSVNTEDVRRRLACDRCHAQKLRCLRSCHGSQAGTECDRCRRASVPCVYSPPSRIGRPARSRSKCRTATSSTTNSNNNYDNRGKQRSARGSRSSSSVSGFSSIVQEQQQQQQQQVTWANPPDNNNGDPATSLAPRETTKDGDDTEVVVPLTPPTMVGDRHLLDATTTDVDLIAFLNNSPISCGDKGSAELGTSAACMPPPHEDLTVLVDAAPSGSTNNVEAPEPEPEPEPAPGPAGDCKDGRDHVQELMGLVLSLHELLRRFEQWRCTNAGLSSWDKQTLFTRLQNYPVDDMVENARKLTQLVDKLGRVATKRRSSSDTAAVAPAATASWNGYHFMGCSPDWTSRLDHNISSSHASSSGSNSSGPPDERSLFGANWLSDPSFLYSAEPSGISTPKTPVSLINPFVGGNSNVPSTSVSEPEEQGPRGCCRTAMATTGTDIPTILLIVSSYLRLARVFIQFFTDLHGFLLAGYHAGSTPPPPTTDSNPVRRLFPGLTLGSFEQFAGIGLEISLVVQVSEHMLTLLHNSMGLSREHYTLGSDSIEGNGGLPFSNNGATTWNRNAKQTVTPALMRAVQVQERLDVQDELGDSFTQLSLIINSVKKLLQVKPFL